MLHNTQLKNKSTVVLNSTDKN